MGGGSDRPRKAASVRDLSVVTAEAVAHMLQRRRARFALPKDQTVSEPREVNTEELLKFFSVLSHDLKSPIFSIDGFSELLLSDYANKLDEEGLDFLKRIRSSAQQIKKTLDEMSHLTKLLARPNVVEQVNLAEVIDELRLRFNYMIDEGGVTLDVPADLPTIEGDRDKIREAIGALMSNALFFTDQPKGQRRVGLEASKTGSDVVVCVTDNGIGVDPQYQKQIFDLGLKLDKSRGGGPGYGLYLAKRVAESHGGRITVDSDTGKGSRFCMAIPAKP